MKSGKTKWFCSKKCEKNVLKLKKDPRKLRWTRPKKARAK